MMDLTNYSDRELTLVVDNDMALYGLGRFSHMREFWASLFLFTDSQWDHFIGEE